MANWLGRHPSSSFSTTKVVWTWSFNDLVMLWGGHLRGMDRQRPDGLIFVANLNGE